MLNTLFMVALLVGLYVISRQNYLLFHSLAELISVVVATCIFIIVWNTRHNIENGYLLLLGLAFPSVAIIDLLHTLAYKGMEVFANQSTDLPTQLWIAGRLLEAVSLLLAVFFINRRLRFAYAGIGYVVVTALLLASIFAWPIFPVCYRDGSGLTTFKIYSEYCIAGMFLLSLMAFLIKRREVDQVVLRWLCASLVLSIAVELAFTHYLNVYGPANTVGHLLKIVSYYCMYKAIVEVGLTRPYDLLFRALLQRERALGEAKERLQTQAEELAIQNEELQTQAEELQEQAAILTQRQEALRESEERYRTTFDYAPVGIAHMGFDGRWLRTNRRMCDILGYSAEELADKTFQEITYPDDLAKELSLAEELRAGRIATYALEKRYIRKDGTLVWGNLTGALVHDAQGNPKHFIAVVEDITERRTIEARFERERALLSSAIDILPLPIAFCTPTGQRMRENSASRALFGALSPDDCRALTFLSADTRVPILPEQWPIQRALRGEIVSAEECLLRLPDDREIPLLAHAAPVYVHDEVYAAVQALEDISALKVADKAKDEFLAILSHELLTPTTSMLGWSQVAQTGEISAATRQALEVIERNARRQKHLVEDLLDMSRIIHGKIALQPEPAQLWQLVAQQVETIQQTAQDCNLQLHLHAPDDPLPVEVDPVRIGQAISNLLNNAVKFTDAGGGITITGRRDGRWAIIGIRDTGRGIPPEQLPSLFTQFQQLHRDKGTGGLGLGLALVKGFVELHGGTVTAHSAGVGQGSTFTIMLPCRPDAR